MSEDPVRPVRRATLERIELERIASRAGLSLNPQQMDELAAAAPHVAALLAHLPRDRPLGDEPAFGALPGSGLRRCPDPARVDE